MDTQRLQSMMLGKTPRCSPKRSSDVTRCWVRHSPYSRVSFLFLSRHVYSALERCAGEVISEILEVVETFEPEDAQMELVTQRMSLRALSVMDFFLFYPLLFPQNSQYSKTITAK